MTRELDALVAEKVMGWKRDSKNPGAWIPPGMEPLRNCHYTAKPGQFTTDPTADYEVLKHVREKWAGDGNEERWPLLDAFEEELRAIWKRRKIWEVLAYEPGDYSKAALKALGEDVG